MGFRDKLNENRPLAVGIIVGILLVAAGALVVMNRSEEGAPPPMPTQWWYFDLDTGKLFADSIDRVPPFKNDQGHECVMAMVFSCKAACAGKDLNGLTPEQVNGQGLRVAYLQRLTPSAKQSVEEMRSSLKPEAVMFQVMQRMIYDGEFRAPTDAEWTSTRTQDMIRMTEQLREACPSAEQCRP